MKSYLSVAVLALLGANVEAASASMSKSQLTQALMTKLDSIETDLKALSADIHSKFGI